MDLRSKLKWIIEIFGWISNHVRDYLNPIQIATDDLDEIARQEIDKSLRDIRLFRQECDVPDAQMGIFPRPVAQMESDRQGIEFFTDKIIHSDPIVFKGRIFDKKVAVKEIFKDSGWQFRVAEKLNNHENFLHHFFEYSSRDRRNFLFMKHYEETLLSTNLPIDPRNLSRQLCNGLGFLHNLGIVHNRMEMKNVAIVVRGTESIYKIMNFKYAKESADEDMLASDVCRLGYVLKEALLTDLIERMFHQPHSNRPTMICLKQHPLFWTPRDSLFFIINFARQMEGYSPQSNKLKQHLDQGAREVFTTDWGGYLRDAVLEQEPRQELDKNYMRNMFGLVRIIRNLVRINTKLSLLMLTIT